MFSRLVKQLAEKEGVTEAVKAEKQMLWVQKMNNIRSAAMGIVSNDLIYGQQAIEKTAVRAMAAFLLSGSNQEVIKFRE